LTEFAQLLVNGVVIGSYYAIVALGLSLIFGILDIPHFAHGSVAMLSGYVSYVIVSYLNIGLILTVILSMIFAAIVGVLLEKIAYQFVQDGPIINSFIIALALMIIIDNLSIIFFGEDQIILPFAKETVRFLGISINTIEIYLLISSVLLFTLMFIFIKYTKPGKAIRAVSQNRDAAQIVGINPRRISTLVFAIGSSMAGLAGVFIGSIFALYPSMGGTLVMKAFAVIILGGLGSFPGAIIGGLSIGIVENLGTAMVSSSYKDLFAFIILIIVMIFKPNGLFGSKEL